MINLRGWFKRGVGTHGNRHPAQAIMRLKFVAGRGCAAMSRCALVRECVHRFERAQPVQSPLFLYI